MAKWKWASLPCPLCGLATHFFMPNGEYRQAAETFDRALTIGQGQAEDYYQAAVARAMLDDRTQALDHLHAAAARGWHDVRRAEDDPAFDRLRNTPGWQVWLESLQRSP